ncbi:hypothetical protein E8E11_000278 [Didymella keratinophila]|nr:hypothetical protein E8E11_000278 [Didymella keratinophila]
MLSSTRSIYRQTFADPGDILLKKSLFLDFDSSEKGVDEEEMLLIQPRKRSRATSDTKDHADHDHATSHPASWQASAQKVSLDAQSPINAGPFESVSPTQPSPRPFSKTAIADLSLEQLQNLHVLVEERMQIKKRYNSTPLRSIIARQAPGSAAPPTVEPDSDTASDTDTLVNSSTPDNIVIEREPLEVRRKRFNDTPLRRILSRQAPGAYAEEHGYTPRVPAQSRFKPEPREVRRARYNNTPLRRIVSRQTSSPPSTLPLGRTSLPATPAPAPVYDTPIPRNNTPLRRIISRQVSAQIVQRKEDDEVSERADSVIDPDSPVRSRTVAQTTSVVLNDEARIRAYEMDFWKLKSRPEAPALSPNEFGSHALRGSVGLNDEAKIRAYEKALWDKTPILSGFSEAKENNRSTTVTVTEVAALAQKPRRIVVDSKGSPLRRILQRQTSKDWRAAARVGVV